LAATVSFEQGCLWPADTGDQKTREAAMVSGWWRCSRNHLENEPTSLEMGFFLDLTVSLEGKDFQKTSAGRHLTLVDRTKGRH